MKIHEKAKLYDILLKDYERMLEEMKKFKDELENVPNREDVQSYKEESLSRYYAATVGAFSAMAFGLDIKLHGFQGELNWYKKQK